MPGARTKFLVDFTWRLMGSGVRSGEQGHTEGGGEEGTGGETLPGAPAAQRPFAQTEVLGMSPLGSGQCLPGAQ